MTRNKDIINELREISPAVANLEPINLYTVPEGYFETLADVIKARVITKENKTEESLVLDAAGKTMPLHIPDGYFENLSNSILSKIKTQQEQTVTEVLNEISPLLAGISNANVYTVPAGYFESISNKLLQQVSEKKQSKVISFISQRGWVKYAAAASVVVLMAFGINFFFSKSNAQLDSYVKLGLKNYNSEQQLNTGIVSINAADLESYLQMTADSKDAETIASLVDKTKLPEESDYLDGVFLESFMKELEQIETTTN